MGLDDKILAVGGENGNIAIVNLKTRSILTKNNKPVGQNCAVNAIAFIDPLNLLIVGCENGKILCLLSGIVSGDSCCRGLMYYSLFEKS